MENPAVKIIKKDKKKYESIGQILRRLIKGNGIFYDELYLVKMQEHWPKIAGPLQQYAEVVGYKNNILHIEAASSSWAQQIIFYKSVLIEKYKNYSQIRINDIKVASTGKIRITERMANSVDSDEEAALNAKELDELLVDFGDEKTVNKFRNILKKAKKHTKLDQRKHCVVCGIKLEGDRLVCFRCQEKKITATKNIISEYLLEAPWSRHGDICKDLPNISEQDYHFVKEQLIRQTADQLMQGRFSLKNCSNKAKKQLKEKAIFYTMLRTGLTPDKINDSILKEHTGDKVYNALYSQY